MIISITGFMGAGKTELARLISEEFRAMSLDLDSEIERGEGWSIAEIFELQGETHFRTLEERYLKQIIEKHKTRIAPKENSDIKLCLSDDEELLCWLEDNFDLSDLLIISLGGGTLNNPALMELVKKDTLCIYLNTPLNIITERLNRNTENRPLLKTEGDTSLQERIEELYSNRIHTYQQAADIIVGV